MALKNLNNSFTRNVSSRGKRGRRLVSRKEIIEAAKGDKKGAAITAAEVLKTSAKLGVSQLKPKNFKKFAKTGFAKDLAVNAGGLVGSKAGASVAGPVGNYAGDLAGAKIARGVVNKGYADIKAFKNRKSGESRKDIQKRANKKANTLNKLDKKRNEHVKDGVGWAVGNSSADILDQAGVKIPFKGAAIAMRTTDTISKNISDVKKGKKSAKQGAKDTAKDLYDSNIKKPLKALRNPKKALQKATRRGRARERLAFKRANKKIEAVEKYGNQQGFEFQEMEMNGKTYKKRRRKKRRRL